MPPGLKTLAAVAAAAAMVGAAVIGRSALDTKSERDGLRLTVVCDPQAKAFCEAAAAADDRLTLKIETPDVTTKRLTGLDPGERPDFQAWVSAGPWLQMAVSDPAISAMPINVNYVASTPVVFLTLRSQKFDCGKPPAGCLPLPAQPPAVPPRSPIAVGLPPPRRSGIGLAGLTQIVLARSQISATDLDLSAIQTGKAADAINALIGHTNPRAGLEQLNANFSGANPLVTIRAAAPPLGERAAVVTSEPAVRVVLHVGFLGDNARMPLSGSEPGGRALAKAAIDAGWDQPGDPSGGLPDPGVLAALQDAWPRS
jgi:hypothetical protein